MPVLHRLVRNLLLAALLAMAVPLASSAPALAGIEPGPGKAWLVIASRTRADDAIALARRYAGRFPGAVVFRSTTGYFGVSLGWAGRGEAEPLRRTLIGQGAIPSDSYFHSGERFIEAIWAASNTQNQPPGHFLSATYLLDTASPPSPQPAAGQPGYVTGLNPNGDNYLSLRTGPGTGFAEIARMRPDTPLTILGTQGGWHQVSLSNGMSGWAYGRYIARGEVPMIGPAPDDVAAPPIPEIGPETRPDRQVAAGTDMPATPPPAAAAPSAEPQAPPVPEPPAQIGDQKRVALVFGNSAYRHTVELPNPRNDAEAMAAKLSALGFEVVTSLDGDKVAMEGAVRDFVRAMADADVVLFFYAGHGMQVNGNNYLIPVDARLEDATALDFETIDLNTILNFMNQEGRISIALLDACRDNPLSRRFARSLGATRSAFIGRGLAAPSAGTGQVLIGFATAPGEVALDGEGGNSPFTTALLDHIGTEGLEVELMLKRVKQAVYEATGKEQEPWHNSALRREFYFNPAN